MINLKIDHLSPEQSVLSIEGLEKSSIPISSKKINDLNFFSSLGIFFGEKLFGKTYIRLDSGDQHILVKVSEISRKLGISKEEILKAEKENSLNDLIGLSLESKKYHISYAMINEYKEQGNLEYLRYLEYLADSLELPLYELVDAQKDNRLQEYLENAQLIEQKCLDTFEKLDKIYQELEGELISKGSDERMIMKMDKKELQCIKNTIRTAYKTLAKYPTGPEEKVEQVISITKDHHILVESSKDFFKMTGLFGKYIGYGVAGVVVRSINLLEGDWSTGKEAVLKIPQITDPGSKLILQEEKLLNKIHADGPILGIQKQLRVIRDIFKGIAKHCHLGPLYEKNLSNVIDPEKNPQMLSKDIKISFAYQIMHGVFHMHRKKITNGDIKPDNIFCNLVEEGGIGPLVYLADFGEGIDHSTPQLDREGYDPQSYQKIKEKEDIAATCKLIYSLFTSEPFPEQLPLGNARENLRLQLVNAGLSEDTAQLIMQGLDPNDEVQSTARELLIVIQRDLERIAPTKYRFLLEQSLPLE